MATGKAKATKEAEAALTQDIETAAEALRAGERGRLVFGGLLHKWGNEGRSTSDIELMLGALGVSMPSPARRSTWKQAWGAWVDNAGLNIGSTYKHKDATRNGKQIPLKLEGVSIDKLYYLKDEVTPDNAQELLAWAFNHTDAEAQLRRKGETGADRDGETQGSDKKHLTLDGDLYDALLAVLDRIRVNQGDPKINLFDSLRFYALQFSDKHTDDDVLDLLWRQAHGELSEEEMNALVSRGKELREEALAEEPEVEQEGESLTEDSPEDDVALISGMSVGMVLDNIDNGVYAAEDVRELEKKGKGRKGVLEGIERRLAAAEKEQRAEA